MLCIVPNIHPLNRFLLKLELQHFIFCNAHVWPRYDCVPWLTFLISKCQLVIVSVFSLSLSEIVYLSAGTKLNVNAFKEKFTEILSI